MGRRRPEMIAAQDADKPLALTGAAWTVGMVQRSAGDTDGALALATQATSQAGTYMTGVARTRPSYGGWRRAARRAPGLRRGPPGGGWSRAAQRAAASEHLARFRLSRAGTEYPRERSGGA